MNQESSSHTVQMCVASSSHTNTRYTNSVNLLMALKLILLYCTCQQATSYISYLLITVICICLQNNKIAVIEEHFK